MNVVLAGIGLACGLAVAGGVFALISMLGILPRMADRLGLGAYTYQMETMIVMGGTAGSIVTVYEPALPLGIFLLVLAGFLAGVYVGALAMALAEVLKVIPILCMRVKLQKGIAILVTSMALGKGLGCLYQLYVIGAK